MRNIKKTMFTLVLALAIIFLVAPNMISGVSAKVSILNPASNSIINTTTYVTVNVTGINASNVTFYYKSNLSYTLIGFNSTRNLSQYRLFWNTTRINDSIYTIKVNVSNSTRWAANYSTNVMIDTHRPNLTYINFTNAFNSRRIFRNGSTIEIKLGFDENNITLKNVYANNSLIRRTNFTWNSTENRWISFIRIIGDLSIDKLFFTAVDFSNKFISKNYTYIVDTKPPNITMKYDSKSAFNPLTGKGTKADYSTSIYNRIIFNLTDDINISSHKIYFDDYLINYSNVESRYRFKNYTLIPQLGKHNITIVGNDIVNNTVINETTVYWYLGTASNTTLINWESRTRTLNNLTNTYITMLSGTPIGTTTNYTKRTPSNVASQCFLGQKCGIYFNGSRNVSVEYLNIDYNLRSFFEFNWNKTPLVYINNDTAVARNIISQLEMKYATKIKDIIIMNDSYGKTKFISNKSIFYGRIIFPGNFTNTSQFTDIYYLEDKDNLSNVRKILNTDVCTDSINPYDETKTYPCYLVNNQKTILYVPKIGIITANKDTLPPRLNITYPRATLLGVRLV